MEIFFYIKRGSHIPTRTHSSASLVIAEDKQGTNGEFFLCNGQIIDGRNITRARLTEIEKMKKTSKAMKTLQKENPELKEKVVEVGMDTNCAHRSNVLMELTKKYTGIEKRMGGPSSV